MLLGFLRKECIPFLRKIWIWENVQPVGYQDFWQLIRSIQDKISGLQIWTFLRQILTSFFWGLWLWMKHGFIISPKNPNNSLNNGSILAHSAPSSPPPPPPQPKTAKDCSFSWEGYGLIFFRCCCYSYCRLSPKGADDQWNILCFTSQAIKSKQTLWSSAIGNSVKMICFTSSSSHVFYCGFERIQHPPPPPRHPHNPNSPDLAPPDFHSFPKLKKAISGTHFQSDDDVIHTVEWRVLLDS